MAFIVLRITEYGLHNKSITKMKKKFLTANDLKKVRMISGCKGCYFNRQTKCCLNTHPNKYNIEGTLGACCSGGDFYVFKRIE